MSSDDENLTLAQAAAKAHCSEGRLRKLAAAGGCPADKIGRCWIFPRVEFQQWIARRAMSRCASALATVRQAAEVKAPVALLCKIARR